MSTGAHNANPPCAPGIPRRSGSQVNSRASVWSNTGRVSSVLLRLCYRANRTMPYAENLPPHTLALDDSLVVWRYMTFPSFVSLLQRRELFFPKLATLAKRDPYEGKLPRKILEDLACRYCPEHVRNPYPDGETFARAAERRNREGRVVNCWHISEVESAAMWNLYSGDRGLAIRTTLGGLKRSFAPDSRPVYISQVEYLDFSDTAGPTLPYHSGYAKRRSFAHERELRACTFISEGDVSPGAFVVVDLAVLIDAVFVAPESEPWIRDVAEGAMSVYGVHKPLIRSVLLDDVVL
jgi:hypothetical protein